MSKIRDAVSAVFTCGGEIFAIQRQNYLGAFPGYWAFPGGKVDEGDEKFVPNDKLTAEFDKKIFGAVLREVKEELGVDLRQLITEKKVNSVHLLGLAVTPDFNPYRFATYFFRIDLKEKIPFVVDQNEVQTAHWAPFKRLYGDFTKGKMLAVPPVVRVMEAFSENPHTTQIEDLNFSYKSDEEVPFIEPLKGIKQLMPLSHTLPPAIRTNAFLIGDEDNFKILIDPSPKSDEEYKKLKHTLKRWRVDKVFITHHHPDHYERSNQLAKDLNIPVLLSNLTLNFIQKRTKDFFAGISLEVVKENDCVTKWLGQDVLVMEVPGHDEGQLALYSADLSWFLAGDLFQGIGTVVIGGEEGDMQKYFATLEKVIELSPKVIFPSHGIGLGGTYFLEKTLKHRQDREKEILNLHEQGFGPEEMLPLIYKDVPKTLWPYALQNINKHLEKLRIEKKITFAPST